MQIDLATRLERNMLCIGAWQSAPSPLIAEAMASCGFHWLAVDMEHGTVSASEAEDIFRAVERHGVAPMVRLPSADPYLARRLLDAGAQGIIVPVSESAVDFKAFADHCLYPPAGRRGVGLSRCNLWGDEFESYLNTFRPALIPQIETRKGVAAADGLAALECVSAIFTGPYDLSADLGAPGDFDSGEFTQSLATVKDACARNGKPMGYHQVAPDRAALARKIEEGYKLLAFGTEIIAMRSAFAGLRDITGA
jgi:2-keto-3-deoxy-L-rhamnonate aldolase RhmA